MDVVNDIDGIFYVAGNRGEIEEDQPWRRMYVNQADAGIFSLNNRLDLTAVATSEAVVRVYNLNYWKLLEHTNHRRAAITPIICQRVAYLRVMSLARGLVDTSLGFAQRGLSYTDVRLIDGATQITWNDGNTDVDVDDPMHEDPPDHVADHDWRAETKKKFANLVCIVAYFFRVRAHHWTEDMQDRYVAVWRRCLYEEDDCGLAWEFVAHCGLHHVYPDVLDRFWTESKDTERCAGTLSKRWTSLPAGVAAVGAVKTGALDLLVVFPALRDILKEPFDELDRCVRMIGGRTWVGSVNRRYYGAGDLVIDEHKLGSLAAVIIAALGNTGSNAPLANSQALKRVADNAPITGSMIANVMQKATQDERMVDALFMEAEEEP